MIRKKAHADDLWLERACASLVASFANGITKDKAAINAAIATSWSNGQTEGQTTKLKLIKRTAPPSSICFRLEPRPRKEP